MKQERASTTSFDINFRDKILTDVIIPIDFDSVHRKKG